MQYLKKKLEAFKYAFAGIKSAFSIESNLFIHFTVAVLTIFGAYLLSFNKTEWLILFLNIALVISFEMINTSIELLCDFVTLQKNEKIKNIKDIAAAAVLIACIFAFISGIILFFPKIFGA